MAVAARNQLQDLIIVGSPRIAFHTMIPHFRQTIPNYILDNLQLVSNEQTLVRDVVVCKYCHKVFTDARWDRRNIRRHLEIVHHIALEQNFKNDIKNEDSNLTAGRAESKIQNQIVENIQLVMPSEREIAPNPQPQFHDVATQTWEEDPTWKPKEIPLLPPIEKEKINIMWEAIAKIESAPYGKKRGRKPKPKPEGMPVREKKKRGRPTKGEKRVVPEKKIRSLKPKAGCLNDSVNVLVEDGNLKMLNV